MRIKQVLDKEDRELMQHKSLLRIPEDVKVVRNMEEINNEWEERKEMAILLDLKTAYPRVYRPIL